MWSQLISHTTAQKTILSGTEQYLAIKKQFAVLDSILAQAEEVIKKKTAPSIPPVADTPADQPADTKTPVDRTVINPDNIIYFTNIERKKLGLAPLSWSAKLTRSARAKSQDMFANQYFAHKSPVDPDKDFGYFIQKQSYDFARVSENLAMGGFDSAQQVVDSWMKSPGHRANIVFSGYRDIGVSAQTGMMNGQQVVIIVQHFGLTKNTCPIISSTAEENLKTIQAQAEAFKANVQDLGKQINDENSHLTNDEMDNLVLLYNTAIRDYNDIAAKFTTMVNEYNQAVQDYDNCIKNLNQ